MPKFNKMNKNLSILSKVLSSAEIEKSMFEIGFITSSEVVIEASGLRLEAVRVIAREQGVEIEDTACRCIDESLLAALADAHVWVNEGQSPDSQTRTKNDKNYE